MRKKIPSEGGLGVGMSPDTKILAQARPWLLLVEVHENLPQRAKVLYLRVSNVYVDLLSKSSNNEQARTTILSYI